MHLFTQIQTSYMLTKTLSFLAAVIFAIYIIQKGLKISKFKMDKVEKTKEIGSAWVVTVALLAICNIDSISHWLMVSNDVEVFIITLMGIALAIGPIVYSYNKYSDIEKETKCEDKMVKDTVDNMADEQDEVEDDDAELNPIDEDAKEELYL